MVVLTFGDVVGAAGCDYFRLQLPALKKRYGADVVVVNGENSAEGNGILPGSAKHLRDSGADVITTGNHALRRREVWELLDKKDGIIRPANYHPDAPGCGVYTYDAGRIRLCVVNIQGRVYMDTHESPFDCIDRLLPDIDTPNILVDFHAEATSEKECMGFYLDGKVSAVVGTHTHVPTADARVLANGTGYITDLGMCGGLNSVLGVTVDKALYRMRTGLPVRFETAREELRLSGAAIEIDEKSGRCLSMESFALL
ncbi:MAG: TIGR00282 family metallophosphoesterase [Oscillospiraceae bacterium]